MKEHKGSHLASRVFQERDSKEEGSSHLVISEDDHSSNEHSDNKNTSAITYGVDGPSPHNNTTKTPRRNSISEILTSSSRTITNLLRNSGDSTSRPRRGSGANMFGINTPEESSSESDYDKTHIVQKRRISNVMRQSINWLSGTPPFQQKEHKNEDGALNNKKDLSIDAPPQSIETEMIESSVVEEKNKLEEVVARQQTSTPASPQSSERSSGLKEANSNSEDDARKKEEEERLKKKRQDEINQQSTPPASPQSSTRSSDLKEENSNLKDSSNDNSPSENNNQTNNINYFTASGNNTWFGESHKVNKQEAINQINSYINISYNITNIITNNDENINQDHNNNPIVEAFEKDLDAQNNNLNPNKPYRGIGVKAKAKEISVSGEKKFALEIEEIMSLEFIGRFKKEGSKLTNPEDLIEKNRV